MEMLMLLQSLGPRQTQVTAAAQIHQTAGAQQNSNTADKSQCVRMCGCRGRKDAAAPHLMASSPPANDVTNQTAAARRQVSPSHN